MYSACLVNTSLSSPILSYMATLCVQVKDQGECRSSSAFSAMGALEGQNFKKSGHLLELSIQQAIDCSWLYGNRGCHGGLATNVFEYVNRVRGVCTSSSYSYIGYVSSCYYITELLIRSKM